MKRAFAVWSPQRPGSRRWREIAAFSLIEILIAVSLLAVIMLGLLAMFYQTQRAMRLGSTQVDVLETGRAVMQTLTDDLKQMVASGDFTNVLALTTSTLVQPRNFGDEPQSNRLQEIFFLRRENDRWIGTGYFVDPITPNGGAGSLHRFNQTLPVSRSNALPVLYNMFVTSVPTNTPRVAERIIHLQLKAYDRTGTNIGFSDFTYTNEFLPAYVDIELGVLEPRTFDRFRAKYPGPPDTGKAALDYLASQIDRVHLFRQRIPIRTVQ
jgi:type II secretory pathway pseudopilin PulG